jgi:WbqC-like protein
VTVAAIHQPEYLPWLGLVAKARRADVFILLDNVQFDRASLQHRARVAGANGLVWLTIPFVHRFPQRIDELAVADPAWPERHWKTLQACYGRAPAWRAVAPALHAFLHAPYARLVDATVASVELLLEAFAARPRVLRASTLDAAGDKSALVLDLCRKVGATRYLAGKTGAAYLDAAAFAAAGVAIEVQSFNAPPFARARPLPPEARGLSAVDAWVHLGREAPALLEAA